WFCRGAAYLSGGFALRKVVQGEGRTKFIWFCRGAACLSGDFVLRKVVQGEGKSNLRLAI
ncbi:hypothetical protein, partial [Alistipes communis]|uniref:hypothetical protein n=1 Tax=Alistipes communis TaxID=2585118 RepID=UPI00241CAB32